MNQIRTAKMDKTAFSVARLDEQGDDRAYWQTRTPLERLKALELLRQAMYGYDPVAARVEKVLTVVPLAATNETGASDDEHHN